MRVFCSLGTPVKDVLCAKEIVLRSTTRLTPINVQSGGPTEQGCHRPSGGGGGGGEGGLDGCVSKRKAEKEDGPSQKEAAAVVIREQNQGADAKTDEVVWDDGNDYDSDDDVETVIAKVKARFDAFIERNKQWLWYRGDFPNEGHSVHDADGGGAVVVHGV